MTKVEMIKAARALNIKGAHDMKKADLQAAILSATVIEPLNDIRLGADGRTKNAVHLDGQRGIKTVKGNDLYLPQKRRVGYRVLRQEINTDKLSTQHRIVLASVNDQHYCTCDEIAVASLENGLITRQKPAYIAATALSKFNRLGLVEKIKLDPAA